jgi:hypothetical protein
MDDRSVEQSRHFFDDPSIDELKAPVAVFWLSDECFIFTGSH